MLTTDRIILVKNKPGKYRHYNIPLSKWLKIGTHLFFFFACGCNEDCYYIYFHFKRHFPPAFVQLDQLEGDGIVDTHNFKIRRQFTNDCAACTSPPTHMHACTQTNKRKRIYDADRLCLISFMLFIIEING